MRQDGCLRICIIGEATCCFRQILTSFHKKSQREISIPIMNFQPKNGGYLEVENSQYILQCPGWCQTYQNLNRKFVRVCQTQLQREEHRLQEENWLRERERKREQKIVKLLDFKNSAIAVYWTIMRWWWGEAVVQPFNQNSHTRHHSTPPATDASCSNQQGMQMIELCIIPPCSLFCVIRSSHRSKSLDIHFKQGSNITRLNLVIWVMFYWSASNSFGSGSCCGVAQQFPNLKQVFWI